MSTTGVALRYARDTQRLLSALTKHRRRAALSKESRTIRQLQTSSATRSPAKVGPLHTGRAQQHPAFAATSAVSSLPQSYDGSDYVYQGTSPPEVPAYLSDTYTWAYLSEKSVPILDNNFIVSSILWGNANKLMTIAIKELQPGMRVLQPACVYGNFSRRLAERVGPSGHLVVSDVAKVQLDQVRVKVSDLSHVTLARADARSPVGGPFDAVCCFFLLHEVPDDVKRDIVKALFQNLQPGGKIVFVDYHEPSSLHPLKPIMSLVFDKLEPFAKGLWQKEIMDFCPNPEAYEWSKETYFGGLYQKVIAQALS